MHLRAQVPAEGAEQAAGLARGVMDALRSEYGGLEADLALAWAAAAPPAAALEPADAARVLALLLTLPHGVLKYSHAVPGALAPSPRPRRAAPRSRAAPPACATSTRKQPRGARCGSPCSCAGQACSGDRGVRSAIPLICHPACLC